MTNQPFAFTAPPTSIELLNNRQGYRLEKALPWGRSYREYQQMFALTAPDISTSMIDVASGVSSFNAELYKQGYKITSCEPLYAYNVNAIEQRFEQAYPQITNGIAKCHQQYRWGYGEPFISIKQLGQERRRIARYFFQDYPAGKQEERYIAASLPNLPFENKEFNLAVCSYFLFTYSDNFDGDFHLAAIAELLRVAREVRIFPIISLTGSISPWLSAVQQCYSCRLVEVPYHFQKGANQFLRIYF